MTKKATTRKKAVSSKLRSSSTRPDTFHVIPQKGSWAVKREGASRATKITSRKDTAIFKAKVIARSTAHGTVVVHRKDGTIEKRVKTKKK
jgi:hypothetical protein